MATPVEEIKQRLSILDVVGSYVTLQHSGKHYKAKSPFTNERTPSFFVSPDRGTYYCFSTNKGGDMFTFVQEMEGVDFKGALRILAERAGVSLKPVDPKEKDRTEKLYSILEETTQFFENALREHPDITAYISKRGVRPETISRFRLGYALPEWRALRTHLLKKDYEESLLIEAGLMKTSEKGKEGYDTFRDRVMFPICDPSGRVVGFSGRTMSQDPASPKYVNSPETPLFEKSRILFGYDKAKQGIRTYDFTLIVEGQFDLVLSHQAGYTNTVAISGTALSQTHIELIDRLSHNVVLALDSDVAGVLSAKRSARALLARGMDVKVARIEGGKDPADLVREDPGLLKRIIGASEHVIPFLLRYAKDTARDERTYKLLVREEVIPFVALIQNHIDSEHFEGVVAEATGVSKDSIHHEVVRYREQEVQDSPARVAPSMPETRTSQVRMENLLQELYGILLWQESEENPVLSCDIFRKHLEFVLGHASMQNLQDWSSERQNEAIFKAETAYAEKSKHLAETVTILLSELYVATLKERLVRAKEAFRTSVGSQEERLADINAIHNELREAVQTNRFLNIARI